MKSAEKNAIDLAEDTSLPLDIRLAISRLLEQGLIEEDENLELSSAEMISRLLQS
jgi:hypothetical protein